MLKQLPLRLRSAAYALRGGFLVRPLVIAVLLGLCGAVLSSIEEAVPGLSSWVPATLFPSHQDAQVAQVILSVIATSIMTVVSIVFAILLMTLTLASMQFSPRILISFVRDRGTQWTLGIFLGTFSYCLAALPAARSMPQPFAPVLTVLGAMLLALASVGWLLFFIHHISHAISVNHIVDRIARETEGVIDALMPHPQTSRYRAPAAASVPEEQEFPILNEVSGYIRFIDTRRLLAFARMHHLRVRVTRSVGHFVPAGIPLLMVSRRTRLDRHYAVELTGAFDIGPMRTLQQDVEFGVIQIVDIALRAISPAVNDPSTAISCIDQLTRILIRWVGRVPPELAAVQSAARGARRAALDRSGRAAEHRDRADPRLRNDRCRGQPAAVAAAARRGGERRRPGPAPAFRRTRRPRRRGLPRRPARRRSGPAGATSGSA